MVFIDRLIAIVAVINCTETYTRAHIDGVLISIENKKSGNPTEMDTSSKCAIVVPKHTIRGKYERQKKHKKIIHKKAQEFIILIELECE